MLVGITSIFLQHLLLPKKVMVGYRASALRRIYDHLIQSVWPVSVSKLYAITGHKLSGYPTFYHRYQVTPLWMVLSQVGIQFGRNALTNGEKCMRSLKDSLSRLVLHVPSIGFDIRQLSWSADQPPPTGPLWMTERYAHLAPENLRDAVNVLEDRSHYGHTELCSVKTDRLGRVVSS